MTNTVRAFETCLIVFIGAVSPPCSAALAPDELFARVAPTVWRLQTTDAAGKALAIGSAVVVAPEVLITNCHVLKGAAALEVVQGPTKHKASLLHADAERDLCQIAVPGVTVSPVVLSDQQPRVGQRIYTIGSPRGFDATLSDGLVSGLRREPDGRLSMIQISAPISPGSSGGGLFDDDGRLLGITTAGVGGAAQNLNFARPSSQVSEVPERAALALERWRQRAAGSGSTGKASGPQQLSGRLEITDRYGERTNLAVQIVENSERVVRYTSGDAMDASNTIVAVRIGSHVGTVSTGALWSFPLREHASGSALVTFDSESVPGKIDWRVERADAVRAVVVAEVVVPMTHGSLSASQNRLVGTWRAEYDGTYPIPLSTHFSARELLASSSESTHTLWVPAREP